MHLRRHRHRRRRRRPVLRRGRRPAGREGAAGRPREKVAEKIRISGGGRCNFTNRDLDARAPEHFLGENPHFCRSALARYTPQDFIALVQRHGIPFHEKHKGQLFGDRSSARTSSDMLLREVRGRRRHALAALRGRQPWHGGGRRLRAGDQPRHGARARGDRHRRPVDPEDRRHRLRLSHGARQFGLRVVEPRPALVPLTFDGEAWAPFAQLAGLALPVRIETGAKKERVAFDEDLLFTHRGLSGPAVLQISSYWREASRSASTWRPATTSAGAAQAKARARAS